MTKKSRFSLKQYYVIFAIVFSIMFFGGFKAEWAHAATTLEEVTISGYVVPSLLATPVTHLNDPRMTASTGAHIFNARWYRADTYDQAIKKNGTLYEKNKYYDSGFYYVELQIDHQTGYEFSSNIEIHMGDAWDEDRYVGSQEYKSSTCIWVYSVPVYIPPTIIMNDNVLPANIEQDYKTSQGWWWNNSEKVLHIYSYNSIKHMKCYGFDTINIRIHGKVSSGTWEFGACDVNVTGEPDNGASAYLTITPKVSGPKTLFNVDGTVTFQNIKVLLDARNHPYADSYVCINTNSGNLNLINTEFSAYGYATCAVESESYSNKLSVDNASRLTVGVTPLKAECIFTFDYDSSVLTKVTHNKKLQVGPPGVVCDLEKLEDTHDSLLPGEKTVFRVTPVFNGVYNSDANIKFSLSGNTSSNTKISTLFTQTDSNYDNDIYRCQLQVGDDEKSFSLVVRAYSGSDPSIFVEWKQPVQVQMDTVNITVPLPETGKTPEFPQVEGYKLYGAWAEDFNPMSLEQKLSYADDSAAVLAEMLSDDTMTAAEFKEKYPAFSKFDANKEYTLLLYIANNDGSNMSPLMPFTVNGDTVDVYSAGETEKLVVVLYGPYKTGAAAAPETDPSIISDPSGTVAGTEISVDGASYRVLADGTVAYLKPLTEAASISIPETITGSDNKTYKVTQIADGAFKNSSITAVKLNNNITEIGARAFYGCKKLRKIVIPKSVKKIGKQAFYKCSSLKSVVIKTTKLTTKTVGAKAFGRIHKKAVAKVPKKKYAPYRVLLKKKGLNGKSQKVKR